MLVLFFPRRRGDTDLLERSPIVEPFPSRHDHHVRRFNGELFVLNDPHTLSFDDVEDECALVVIELLGMSPVRLLVDQSGVGTVLESAVKAGGV